MSVPVIFFRYAPDGTRESSGTIRLTVNGKPVAEGRLKRSIFRQGLEPFEIGHDSITPVSPDYATPFEFQGKIDKYRFELKTK